MTKTITVKGLGKASAAPDCIILTMDLDSKNEDYEKAMNIASENIEQLYTALISAGFEKKSIKTTNFNVHTEYENIYKDNGKCDRVFIGYVVSHSLKLQFDLDMKKLTNALSAISSCPAHPQLSIEFTIKDTTSINDEMLRTAAVNAKQKAEILCKASGAVLGELISINYNWGELNVFSNTRYGMGNDCMERPLAKSISIEIEPDDINVSDTATFVWEIK